MYASFFGLQHEPFSIAPDPRFLYMSERHREALAHLMYGIRGNGGFVLLTGEIGAGKTTVCRAFLEQVPADCEVAYIFNPKLTVHELLKAVCDEFGVAAPAAGTPGVTVQDYVEPLNRHLLATHAAGRKSILIIDEAQNLEPEVLEQLRLLTNLETAERKLLQIMLIGQPELRDMVARPELEQLAQRIVARCHLGPLSAAETAQYVLHRMRVAGLGAASPFTARQLLQIHKLTGGVPRRINLLCDRSLLGAYSRGQAQVDAQGVRSAANEVFDKRRVRMVSERREFRRQLAWGVGIATVAVAVGFGLSVWHAGTQGGGVVGADAGPDLARSATDRVSNPNVAVNLASTAVADLAATAPSERPSPTADNSRDGLAARPLGPSDPIIGWGDEASALRVLARQWGIDLLAGEGCDATRRVGVACYRTQASVVLARQLDRPALIRLAGTPTGAGQHALLLGIDGQQAVMELPQGRVSLPLAGLAVHWRGDYVTLWRSPEGLLGPNPTPAGKAWLDETLQRLPDLAGVALGASQEARLQARLQAFQLTQGLQPDGKVGPVTLMRLNQAAGVPEPRLEHAATAGAN
ncbi:ExeA family protein [Sphaerotilus mobilis]|uniref:Type II secretion system protein A n=1 Tax=Sphaerotilus mobilis TaxID=47994 RepID=A0A4Q7LQ96_9BURK|nr:ExeA family protein [Sphaerotilus mobilis]RZS56996.1 type II secretion system protein A [Sphaerotilus mobilis]